MANATISDVENMVHSCGFYKHKARDIVLASQMLLSDYGGKVPGTMEELLRIPGVGRKTANLLLGDLYKTPGSVVCDTHCIRICGRLGLSKGKEPEKSSSSYGKSCHLKKAVIFATELFCLVGKFAPQGIPSVPNASLLPTVTK